MSKENLHLQHRDRLKQRFLEHGLDSFEPHQILELILFFAIPRKDTNPIAHNLLKRFGSLAEVFNAPASELEKVDGIGPHASMFLKVQHSLFLKYHEIQSEKKLDLKKHDACVDFIKQKLKYLNREEFHITCVDNKLQLIRHLPLFKGNVNSAVINIRELTAKVLETDASAVIISHNHPSGYPQPSEEDEYITETLMLSLKYQDVELLEHIIIAGEEHYSFHKNGKMSKYRENINKKIPRLFVAQPNGGFK